MGSRPVGSSGPGSGALGRLQVTSGSCEGPQKLRTFHGTSQSDLRVVERRIHNLHSNLGWDL